MKNLIWYLKQLLPLTYWETYQEGIPYSPEPYKAYFTIYRMCFGKVFNAVTVEVKDYWIGGRQKSTK